MPINVNGSAPGKTEKKTVPSSFGPKPCLRTV